VCLVVGAVYLLSAERALAQEEGGGEGPPPLTCYRFIGFAYVGETTDGNGFKTKTWKMRWEFSDFPFRWQHPTAGVLSYSFGDATTIDRNFVITGSWNAALEEWTIVSVGVNGAPPKFVLATVEAGGGLAKAVRDVCAAQAYGGGSLEGFAAWNFQSVADAFGGDVDCGFGGCGSVSSADFDGADDYGILPKCDAPPVLGDNNGDGDANDPDDDANGDGVPNKEDPTFPGNNPPDNGGKPPLPLPPGTPPDADDDGVPDWADNCPDDPDNKCDDDDDGDDDDDWPFPWPPPNQPGGGPGGGGGGPPPAGTDTDGDGIDDAWDPWPNDPTNPGTDSDGDGVPDDLDPDDNNDGIPDVPPPDPDDPDGDGIPNDDDPDDDNDGIPDTEDPDDDGDGIPDEEEMPTGCFITDLTPWPCTTTNITDPETGIVLHFSILMDADCDGVPDCCDEDPADRAKDLNTCEGSSGQEGECECSLDVRTKVDELKVRIAAFFGIDLESFYVDRTEDAADVSVVWNWQAGGFSGSTNIPLTFRGATALAQAGSIAVWLVGLKNFIWWLAMVYAIYRAILYIQWIGLRW
jgi:hypothetical protein